MKSPVGAPPQVNQLSDVLAEWDAITDAAPWRELPPAHRRGSLPRVLRAAFEVVRAAGAADARDVTEIRAYLARAAEHGHERRGVEFPQDVILTEFDLLRRSLVRVLTSPDGAESDILVVLQLDIALQFASRASLLGYHGAEIAATRSWDLLFEALVSDAHAHLRKASRGTVPRR